MSVVLQRWKACLKVHQALIKTLVAGMSVVLQIWKKCLMVHQLIIMAVQDSPGGVTPEVLQVCTKCLKVHQALIKTLVPGMSVVLEI